jgi:MerR family transcriptional regulator, light-induced transcriptional regulator
VTHGIDAHSGSMLDDICTRLAPSLSSEVRESIGFFVDQLVASLALGAPSALTDQLLWQTRRLRALAPDLDTGRLARVTRAVLEERLGGADGVGQLALTAADHLELARGDLAHGPAAEQPDPGFGDLAGYYLELALADGHDEAVDLVLASGLTPQDVLLHLLEPAQVELGRRWERDDVSVAQEHETTALTQRVMALLRGRRRRVAPNGRSVLTAAVGEELHSVGLEMVTDLLGLAGWSVEQAPGAVEHTTVVEQVARTRPDVVALSVTLLSHVVELRSVIEALKSDERTRHVPVVVGGRPFRRDPALAGLVGADAWAADGRGAVEACRRAVEGLAERHVNDVTRELVNPLETMLGLAALLKDDATLSHRQRDLAGRIIKAGGQLMTVVEDLGHGLVEIHGGPDERSSSGPVDLDELVESLLVRHQGRAAQRDIVMRQIRMPAERGRVTVEGDVSQLERVIDTLFDNAVAVTPSSGVITARVRRTGGVVTVAVADEGPPIPAHGHEAIFDAGRATSSSGATDLGPWRGLALVRRIAEQHGGTVEATSDHRGAVFTLQLPLSRTMLEHEVPDVPETFPRLSVVREPGSGSAG